MRCGCHAAVVLGLTLGAITILNGSVLAQTLPAVYRVTTDIEGYVPADDPRQFTSVVARFMDSLICKRYEYVFKALRDDFRADAIIWQVKDSSRTKFIAEMDNLISESQKLADSIRKYPEADVHELFVACIQSGRFQSFRLSGAEIVFFDKPNQIRLSYQEPDEGPYHFEVDSAQALDLRLRANTLDKLCQKEWGPVVRKTLDILTHAESRWANYLNHGVSQYPWEMWLNGKAMSYSLESPPTSQLVFIHPDAAIEVGPIRKADATLSEAVTVAVLGWIKYYGADEGSLFGGAAVASFRDDMGMGVGGTLYFGPGANLGLVWHDTDRNGSFDGRPFLSLSIDLFQAFGPSGGKFAKALELVGAKREAIDKELATLSSSGTD